MVPGLRLYLAAQAPSQISIPPEVIEQGKQLDHYAGWADIDIEAKLKQEAEAAIKDNLEKQIESLQYSHDLVGSKPAARFVAADAAEDYGDRHMPTTSAGYRTACR